MAEPLQPRALFGGAIVLGVPARFADISEFRQVPDNQEVFADAKTDQSVIVELVELAEEAQDAEAAAFHFGSIANDNDAANTSTIEQAPLVQPMDPPHEGLRTVCWGTQNVAKFNEGQESVNCVRVHVACFRLRGISTDCVVSFNSPVVVSDASSSAEAVDRADVGTFNLPPVALQLFQSLIQTFEIKDYTLFQG